MTKSNKYIYYFAFLVIAILAFWQIVLYVHPAKYDMIDCYYPWRYFIGENLQHGQLPLWNPYQNLGSPIHADPSSGAWYPIVWIIGYFYGYNVYSIGFEFFIHVFIAGIGFYKLSKTLKLRDDTAFIAGVCYMLCGVFIGNAQHLGYIISACWLPFVLNYYLKMGEENQVLNPIKAALFLFMMITGGYPAFTIILFYLLLIFFFYFVLKRWKEKNKKAILQFVTSNALFFVLTILLSAGMLLAIYQVSPFITRTNQFALKSALFSPFSPQSAISFFLPYATTKDIEFFNTDFSMSNAYFGLPMILFFIMSLFQKKTGAFKILFWFALFSLTAAVGSYLPVRTFLFNYIPMMNLFRFPSVFRLFVIVGFVASGAFWLEGFLNTENETRKKNLKRIILILVAIFTVAIVASRMFDYLNMFSFIEQDIFDFSKRSLIHQHIAFQAGFQILILGGLFYVIYKITDKAKQVLYLTVLIVFDLIFAAQLNEPYTAFSKEFSAKECNKHIQKFPKGFPMVKDIPIKDVKQDELYFGPFWRNVNIFQKQVSREGFNSFAFAAYFHLTDDLPQLYDATTKNKIAFLSDHVLDENKLEQIKKDSAFTNDMVFFKSKDLGEINTSTLKHNVEDVSALIDFAPNKFVVATKTKQAQVITLLQNDYYGWEVYVNDQQVKHYTTNSCLISAIVPAGKNVVRFDYDNSSIRKAMWISLLTLGGCLLLVFADRMPKRK